MLINSSHQLVTAIKEVGEDIEEFLTGCPLTNIDDHFIYKLQNLCKECKYGGKWSPLNLFDMSNEVYFSIVSTAFTYIIVMIQFKTTELPLKA